MPRSSARRPGACRCRATADRAAIGFHKPSERWLTKLVSLTWKDTGGAKMQMLRVIAASLFVVGMMVAGPTTAVGSEGFAKGLAAYNRSDYAEAMRQWKPLAEQGHADAQNNLGLMYDNGHGVSQDHAAAGRWYRLAAAQGSAIARFNLGVAYANGEGVPQDHAEAVRWYRLAAEQGNAGAQNNLGLMYGNGQGVPQHHAAAYMWFNLAAAQGDKDASKNRDIAAKKLTAADLGTAQRLSRECLARNYKNC